MCVTVTGTCLGLQNAGLASDLSLSFHLPELLSPRARNGWKNWGWRGLVPKLSCLLSVAFAKTCLQYVHGQHDGKP